MQSNGTLLSALCEICRGPFDAKPNHANRFCSRACYFQWHRRGKIACTCPVCGASFLRSTREAGETTVQFCSNRCRGLYVRIPPSDRLIAGLLHEDAERVPGLGPCWTWTGRFNRGTGYGEILSRELDRRLVIATHRLAYEVASGQPIPDEMSILHTCDVRLCCRDDDAGIYVIDGVARPRFGHLWLGTQADNMADMAEKGRAATGDRNGSRLHPERRVRGERWTALIGPSLQHRRPKGSRNQPTH